MPLQNNWIPQKTLSMELNDFKMAKNTTAASLTWHCWSQPSIPLQSSISCWTWLKLSLTYSQQMSTLQPFIQLWFIEIVSSCEMKQLVLIKASVQTWSFKEILGWCNFIVLCYNKYVIVVYFNGKWTLIEIILIIREKNMFICILLNIFVCFTSVSMFMH